MCVDRNGKRNAFYIQYLSSVCVKYVIRNILMKETMNSVIVTGVKLRHAHNASVILEHFILLR